MNGYTGTLGGNAAIGSAGSGAPLGPYPANQGLVLDGTSGTHLTTSLQTGISNQFTLMAWIYMTDYTYSYPTIISKAPEGDDCDLLVNYPGTGPAYPVACQN